jgi:hypothetical protein
MQTNCDCGALAGRRIEAGGIDRETPAALAFDLCQRQGQVDILLTNTHAEIHN